MAKWRPEPEFAKEAALLRDQLRAVANAPTREFFAGGRLQGDMKNRDTLVRVVKALADSEVWRLNFNNALFVALRRAVPNLKGSPNQTKKSWQAIAEAIFQLREDLQRDEDNNLLSYSASRVVALPDVPESQRKRIISELRYRLAQELLRLEADQKANPAADARSQLPRDVEGVAVAIPAAADEGEAEASPDGAQSLDLDTHRRRRLLWGAIGCAAAAVLAAVLVLSLLPSGSKHGQTPPSLLAGLRAKVVGKNVTTHQTSYSTNVVADYTDDLTFEATITNDSAEATSSLDLEPFYVQPDNDQTPRKILIAAGPYLGEHILPGVPATVTPASNCFQDLSLDGSSVDVVDTQGAVVRTLAAADAFMSTLEYEDQTAEGLEAVVLGSLAPHSTVTVRFNVFASSNGSSQPEHFQQGGTVAFDRNGDRKIADIGAATPGDRLRVDIDVHDPFCEASGMTTQIRIRLAVNKTQRSVDVIAYAMADPWKPEELGRATVSSTTGAPIKLTVVPDSTYFYSYQPGTTCGQFDAKRRLPDGIAEGGVGIGIIKGFEPRLPCNGQELAHVVRFVAIVEATS